MGGSTQRARETWRRLRRTRYSAACGASNVAAARQTSPWLQRGVAVAVRHQGVAVAVEARQTYREASTSQWTIPGNPTIQPLSRHQERTLQSSIGASCSVAGL